MASLLELQRSFARALRDPAVNVAVRPAANLDIYRNNTDWQFRNALALSYPVLLRRVGDDYFRQLAFHYRERFPSRSGDLHWVGRDFPEFLTDHLRGGDYAWLADLARLEWLRERASVARTQPALGPEALSRFAAEDLGALVFTLQPALFLGASEFPVLSVWQANQTDNASPVDQSIGREQFMVLGRDDLVEVARLTPSLFSYLSALAAGAPLGEAVSAADLDESGLLQALQFTFANGLVTEVSLPDRSPPDQSPKS